MKRSIWIALSLFAAGCIDEPEAYDPVVELGFAPAIYSSVRSTGDDAAVPAEFCVGAWSLPADVPWSSGSGRAEAFLSGERVTESDGVWRAAEPVNWPESSLRLTFMGYAPCEVSARCDVHDGVVFAGVDTSVEQTDLLYTDPQADLSKNDNGGQVPMPFRHALCELQFRMHRAAADAGEIRLRRVVLEEIFPCGDFASLRQPQWRTTGSRSAQLFFEGEAVAGKSIRGVGQSRFVIPQHVTCAVTVDFDYVNEEGNVLSRHLSTRSLDIVFEPGRRYTCTLTLMPDDVKLLCEIIDFDI